MQLVAGCQILRARNDIASGWARPAIGEDFGPFDLGSPLGDPVNPTSSGSMEVMRQGKFGEDL